MRTVWVLSIVVLLEWIMPFSKADEKISLPELIEKLGDRKFSHREQSQLQLLQLGEKARPLLEKATRSPDPEIAFRAVNVLRTLNQLRDTQEILQAPKARFRFKEATVAEVLEQILPLIDNEIHVISPEQIDLKKRITLETEELPILDAIQKVFQEAGLSLAGSTNEHGTYWDTHGRVLRTGLQKTASSPARLGLSMRAGTPTSLSFPHSINLIPGELFQSEDNRSITFRLELIALPSTFCRGITGLTITKVLDHQGQPLEVLGDSLVQQKEPSPVEGVTLQDRLVEEGKKDRTVRFQTPTGKVSELKRIEGYASIDVASPVRLRLTSPVSLGHYVEQNGYFLRVENWKIDPKNKDTIATLTLGTTHFFVDYEMIPLNREGKFRPFLKIPHVTLPSAYQPQVEFFNHRGQKIRHKVISKSSFEQVDSHFEGKYLVVIETEELTAEEIEIHVLGRVPTTIALPFRFENLKVSEAR